MPQAGEFKIGPDGQTYQYAETTGMLGATGSSGWIRANLPGAQAQGNGMADLARIKNNVRKMAAQNAPEADIDGYIASEGVTVDDVRNFNPAALPPDRPMPTGNVKPTGGPVGIGEDMLRSAGSGLRTGLEGMAGTLGDAAQMQGDLSGWIAGKFGAAPETQALFRKGGRALSPGGFLPSTNEIHAGTTAAPGVGESYEPKTIEGEYTRTGAQFLPNLVSPGSAARKVASVAVPAILSETAGQLTKGTVAEPYARGAAALAGGVSTMGRRMAVPKAAPAQTTAELGAETNKLFKAAKAEGVVAKPKAMNDLFSKVQTELQDFGHDSLLQPDTGIVVKRLAASRGKPLSLTEVHNLRKIATGASRSAVKADDRASAGIIVKKIDEFLDDPANFNANSDKGRQLLRQGIETSKRKIKSEIVDDIVEKAKNQATGFENGLVTQFRALANNKGRMRSFSKAEQDIIKSIVRRPTLHGLLRAVGMLSPTSTFGGITTGIGLGSGIIPGVVTAGVGAAARKGAGIMTNAKTAKLQQAVASGAVPGFPQLPTDPMALVRLLMSAKSGEIAGKNSQREAR